mmetsp:Transcript_14551/g.19403  ORF Transcript_14551/g.19403 Transcript_14551/m.19403 type:complete len:364 (-) Transcript_14551:250-1341(-)
MESSEVSVNIDELGRASSEWNSYLENIHKSRIVETNISTWSNEALEALRMDCVVVDNALLPRTFFLFPEDQPRCFLEYIVRKIVEFNVPTEEALGAAGAEFWVQKRPSGRESILSGDDEETRRINHGEPSSAKRLRPLHQTIGPRSQRLDWHFDKDEELCAGTGIYLSPQISTVTYLTANGGPTVLLDCAAHPATGIPVSIDDLNCPIQSCQTLELVYPAIGRHLSFDGRKMHAVVPALQRQSASSAHPRITLLVNIWLGHTPLAVQRIPEIIIPQLAPIPPDGPSLYSLFSAAAHQLPTTELVPAPRIALFPGEDSTNQDSVIRPVVHIPQLTAQESFWPAVRLVAAPPIPPLVEFSSPLSL